MLVIFSGVTLDTWVTAVTGRGSVGRDGGGAGTASGVGGGGSGGGGGTKFALTKFSTLLQCFDERR